MIFCYVCVSNCGAGVSACRYHLLNLIDYTSYTIKTKLLNLFIPAFSVVYISAFGCRNTTTDYFAYKILQILFRNTIYNLCHPEYELATNYVPCKEVIILFSIAI